MNRSDDIAVTAVIPTGNCDPASTLVMGVVPSVTPVPYPADGLFTRHEPRISGAERVRRTTIVVSVLAIIVGFTSAIWASLF